MIRPLTFCFISLSISVSVFAGGGRTQTQTMLSQSGICHQLTSLCFQSNKDQESFEQQFEQNLVSGQPSFRIQNENKDIHINTSLMPALQNITRDFLKKARTDVAGVAMINAKSGEVYLLESFQKIKKPIPENMALYPSFLAASLFKMVTSLAYIKKHPEIVDPSKVILPYLGDPTDISAEQLIKKTKPKNRKYESFDRAFAKSHNASFGWMGAFSISAEELKASASALGFNQNIAFDVPMRSSVAAIPKKRLALAETAVGRGATFISPLHAALIAASISQDGMMPSPYIFKNWYAENQYVERKLIPSPHQVMTFDEAQVLQALMKQTSKAGTAKKELAHCTLHTCPDLITVGSKTGTVSQTKWITLFAKGPDHPDVALAIVFYDSKDDMKKPALLAKELISAYYEQPNYQWSDSSSKPESIELNPGHYTTSRSL